jgi:hypothetical protein
MLPMLIVLSGLSAIEEIVEVVHGHHGEIEITRHAEARDYFKSLALLTAEGGVLSAPERRMAQRALTAPLTRELPSGVGSSVREAG